MGILGAPFYIPQARYGQKLTYTIAKACDISPMKRIAFDARLTI